MTDTTGSELQSLEITIAEVLLFSKAGRPTTLLNKPQRVDLPSLAEKSLVLAVEQVFPDVYDALRIRVDYSSVTGAIKGQDSPADIRDGDGNPLQGFAYFDLELERGISAVIGENHSVEIDFGSLYAVRPDFDANRLVVEPAWTVRVDRLDARPLLLDGRIASVDEIGGFLIASRSQLESDNAQVIVSVESESVIQIDGILSNNTDGLPLLGSLSPSSPLRISGSIDFFRNRMRATHIEAGQVSFLGSTDVVEGTIIGRDGGEGADALLTVLGRERQAEDIDFSTFQEFVILTSFLETTVVRPGQIAPLDTDSLMIGQRVQILGELAGTIMNASDSGGVATILPSTIEGYVVSVQPFSENMVIELVSVNGIPAEHFVWNQGGDTPPDPAAFRLAVNLFTFSLNLVPGDRVGSTGLFRALTDDTQDFTSQKLFRRGRFVSLSIRDREQGIVLVPTVDPGTGEPPPNAPSLITLAFSGELGANELLQLDFGIDGVQDVPLDPPLRLGLLRIPTQEDDPLFLIAPEEKARNYTLTRRRTGSAFVFGEYSPEDPFQDEYTQYHEFCERLELELALGAVLYDIHIVGEYNSVENKIDAAFVNVIVD